VSSAGLKVLVLADSRAFHTQRYIGELRRQGCRVLLASLERGSTHHFRLKRRGPIRILHYPLASRQIGRLVKRFQPDVVNPHFVSGYGFAAALSGIHRRVPVVMHLWGSDVLLVPHKSRWHHWKVGKALRAADGMCADSSLLLDAARELADTDARRAIVAWGVERRFLSLHHDNAEISHPLKIIVPRPHEQVYGNSFIIRALTPMILSGDVQLTFPSFGRLADQFRRDSETMVGDSIRYYEPLYRDEFMQLMATHDVYLSNASSDSSPASLIEALALGLIPVVADIPGIREWLDSNSGFLYEPYVGESLRTQLRTLVRGGKNLAEMRQSNYERVKSRAVFEDNIAETIDFMRQVAEGKRL
jgi:hypothetical protein